MRKLSPASIETVFRRIGLVSIGAVLFLILVGGIVRSTGSGMGCPDWPKCFGLLVPPMEVSEIPAEFFASHPEYSTEDFNVYQTWTEYVNRLTGVLIGFFVLGTAIFSLGYWRKARRISFLSIGALLLTMFQGWMGKVVVDKELAGVFVTLHMLIALIILMLLISAVYLGYQQKQLDSGVSRHSELRTKISGQVLWMGLALTGLTLIQILSGTQVRENVDVIATAMNFEGRETWIEQLGGFFNLHRLLWFGVVLLTVLWIRNLDQYAKPFRLARLAAYGVLFLVFAEVLVGMLLGFFNLPPALQPVHLLFASLIFALEFSLVIFALRIERFGLSKTAGYQKEARSLADV